MHNLLLIIGYKIINLILSGEDKGFLRNNFLGPKKIIGYENKKGCGKNEIH